MEKKLTVTKEHLPKRCEICHQSDMFFAEKEYCERCNDHKHKIKNSSVVTHAKNPSNVLQTLLVTLGLLVCIPTALLVYGQLFWFIFKILWQLVGFFLPFVIVFIIMLILSKLDRKIRKR